MMANLPTGWADVQLEELLLVLESGNRPKGGVRGIKDGVPSLGGEHLNSTGSFNFNNIKYVPLDFFNKMGKGHILHEDILIVKDGATTGKTSFVANDFPHNKAVINEHVFLLRCSKKLSSSFLFRYLWSEEGQKKILDNFQGSAQGGINRQFISNTLIPVAPLNEQKRITTKLDHIMPKIDGVKERLDRIPRIIKRFRQSVLTAAVTGKLTEKWREENPDVESAAVLLERIRGKREDRYKKECEIAKKKGERKPKKIHLFNDDEIELPFVAPISWKKTTLGNIVYDFCYGTSEKSDYNKEGTPVVRIPNVLKKYLDLTDLKYLGYIEENNNNKVTENDILIIRSNGSKTLVGNNCIVPHLEKEYAFASYLIRIRPALINANYMFIILNAPVIKEQFYSTSKSSAGINNINTEELATVTLALPPLEEQQEIIHQVDKLFTFADKLELHYKKAKEKIDKLPQSVLAKAFRGELVPQDPNDEPAEKLLERIKEEKARLEAEMKELKVITRKKKTYK